MGYSYDGRPERVKNQEAFEYAKRNMLSLAGKIGKTEKGIVQSRANVAERIIMAVLNRIEKVIRPGPKPEERECYQMSQEMRDMTPELELIVMGIFEQTGGVK